MTDPASQALLDERYGRGRKRSFDKRFAWIAGGALVLAGLAFVLFGGWQQGSDLEFKDLHYSVISDSAVEVDVQVTAAADAEIVCAIEALSESHGTVGWKLVTLPSGDERTRRFESTVVTTSPATTGRVRSCWEPQVG
ncbi:MAG: DUF4307 domain-containing protein [Actinobacteria bacterium]|nr:DUF4307 domain-containing protein [Actinomycetota bacterium]